jgi:hypothetical protein
LRVRAVNAPAGAGAGEAQEAKPDTEPIAPPAE